VLTGRTPESLTAELKQLRRGLGLYHPDLAKRLGPGLRYVCGVTDGDPDLRPKVITRLRDAAGALPPDLSVAVQAALGVHPETRALHKLEERVNWLARRLNRDARTARRRMDDACAMLGEQLGAGRDGRRPTLPSTGWHIESAQSAVLLDDGPPAAIERRVVVAEHDGLDRLVLSRTIPPNGSGGRPDVRGKVLFGGVLGVKEWASETRFQLVLDLPVTLRAGDRHEYCVLWQNPPDQPMRPHYVFTPALRVDHFDLHVRFDRSALPERVFRVTDSFHRDLDEQPRDRDEIAVDPAGEVHLEFQHLAPGHGYGVRWG
jgi:plasmid stabilization system protein ParE